MVLLAGASIAMSLMPIVRSDLQAHFGFSEAQIGLLTSVFNLTFALGSLPAGMAVARWGGRTLAFSIILTVVGGVLFAFSRSYPGFVVGRLLQGLGGSAFLPVGTHLFSHHLRPERQARALGVFGSGYGLGVVSALLIMPSIEKAGGFRAVFLASAAIMVVLGAFAFFQDSVRAPISRSETREPFGAVLRDTARMALNRRLLLLVLVNIGVMAVVVGLLAWTPAFLQDQRQSSAAVAAYLTAGVGVAQLLGSVAGALAMTKLSKPVVLLASITIMCVVTALAPVVPGAGWAIALVVVAGFLTMVMFPAVMGSVPDTVPPKHVGSATGFLNLTNLVATFLAPWVFGVLLGRYGTGPGQGGYLAGYLWLAAFPFMGIGAATAFMLARKRG